jgi:UBX domain-containing protein 1
MSKVRGLFDKKDDDEMRTEQETTESFSGGHRSGLAVEYPDQRETRKVIRVDAFSNGFSVDHGPFRPFSDPANIEFMNVVRSGVIPDELSQNSNGRGELELELHQFEHDFDPSQQTVGETRSDLKPGAKPAFTAFRGKPSTIGNRTIQPESLSAVAELPNPIVPQGACSTSLQLRLPNGQRVLRSFDESSLGNVLVDLIAPSLGVEPASVVISAGFPPRPIEYSDLRRCSIKDLGLSGSTVTISLKK